jgi:hypothetical protein
MSAGYIKKNSITENHTKMFKCSLIPQHTTSSKVPPVSCEKEFLKGDYYE